MNNKVSRFLSHLLLWLGLLWLHFIVINFFAEPWHHVNFVIFFLIISTVVLTGDKAIKKSLALILLLELFVATPFGINALAMLLSVAMLQWLMLTIFGGRSPIIIGLAAAATVFSYRVLLILFLEIHTKLFATGAQYSWMENWKTIGWEILLNGGLVVVVYLFLTLSIKQFRLEYITMRKTEYESKSYFH